MKILHTNMHLKWGGQPNRILTTSRAMAARGHEVHVAGPRGAMLCERARQHGLKTFEDLELRRGFHPLSMRRDVRALGEYMGAERFDIVDTHGSQDTWVALMALRGMREADRPGFVRSRHNTFPVGKHALNRWLYRHVDHIITIMPQVNVEYEGLMAPERITAIPSAPDPERFIPGNLREAARAEFGFAPEDRVIGVVGRLAPEKGHTVLLDAYPRVRDAHPTARLLFVGTGRSRPALEEQCARLGITDRVIFTGFRDDVPRLLQAMDLFVLPPVSGEAAGTALLEAFLMERPVVSTDVGGVKVSVRDGESGRLVAPGDAEALAEAIIDQLSHPERGLQWARRGKEIVQADFTPEQIGRKTEAVYRDVLIQRNKK